MDDEQRTHHDVPAWCLVGLTLGIAVGSRTATSAPESPADEVSAMDPDALSAQELRALPGIGPARALAIVRARWDGLRGGPDAWRDVRGIGEATTNAAAEMLSGRLVEPLGERAYTRGESP